MRRPSWHPRWGTANNASVYGCLVWHWHDPPQKWRANASSLLKSYSFFLSLSLCLYNVQNQMHVSSVLLGWNPPTGPAGLLSCHDRLPSLARGTHAPPLWGICATAKLSHQWSKGTTEHVQPQEQPLYPASGRTEAWTAGHPVTTGTVMLLCTLLLWVLTASQLKDHSNLTYYCFMGVGVVITSDRTVDVKPGRTVPRWRFLRPYGSKGGPYFFRLHNVQS